MKKLFFFPIILSLLATLFLSFAYGEELPEKKTSRPFTIGDNIMPRHIKNIRLPKKFLRGIYLDSTHGTQLSFIRKILPKAKEAGINCFVLDTAPYQSMRPKINPEVIQELKANGIFTIARVVAFQYGLKQKSIEESHFQAIDKLVDLSVEAGFDEIQLDYIRFADGYTGLSLKQKYEFIASLLKRVRDRIKNPAILLATDVFGRIVYNRDDVIGQQLETMSSAAQVICPMVYPSHYTPDRYKVSNPYFTVRQSTIKGLNRIGKEAYMMPYIQAFKIAIGPSRLSYAKYLEAQVQAVEDTAARGWIFWNARNRYEDVFAMLKEFYAKNPQNLATENPSGYNPETGMLSLGAEERGQGYEKKNPQVKK